MSKDSPSPPPPPPDYSRQIQQNVSGENRSREQQARQYNERINAFNQALSQYGSGISGLSDQFGGFSIATEDPQLSSFQSQIDEYQRNLGNFLAGDVGFLGLNFDQPESQTQGGIDFSNIDLSNIYGGMGGEREGVGTIAPGTNLPFGMGNVPTQSGLQYDEFGMPLDPGFSPTGTAYGETVAYDVPNLQDLNFALARNYLGELDALERQLQGLQGQRQTELGRIEDFFGGAVDRYNEQDIDARFLDLNTNFDRYLAEVERERNRLNQFESLIDVGSPRQLALDELAELEGLLQGRIGERDVEQARVDAFREDLRNRLGGLESELGGLSIADLTDPSGYNQRIGEIEDLLAGFESELNTNFGRESGDLSDIERMLSDLQRQRTTEERRLETMGGGFENLARSLQRRASRLDPYDLYALQNLEDELDFLRQDIGGVDSPLAYDFSGTTGTIDEALAQLQNMYGQRSELLGAERQDVANLLSGLTDIQDYDEGSLRDLRSQLEGEFGDLSRFSGGLTENQQAIQDALSQIDDRLRGLGATRRGIEDEALTRLQALREQEISTPEEIDQIMQELLDLRNRSERFGATQAGDEFAAIDALLGREGSRIERQLAESEARRQREAAEITPLLDAQGNLRFPMVNQSTSLTTEQIQSLLSQLGTDEDEIFNLVNPNAFSQNLLGALGT